jgi:hypothetical protein
MSENPEITKHFSPLLTFPISLRFTISPQFVGIHLQHHEVM